MNQHDHWARDRIVTRKQNCTKTTFTKEYHKSETTLFFAFISFSLT